MADVRISNLAAAVAANLDGNSLVPTTDSEIVVTTVKVTLAQMRTSLLTRANGNFAATDYLSIGGASPPSSGWIRVDGTTVTASTPVFSAIQTWNQGATVFTGILFNVTDTTSSASSLLTDLQVAGFSKFKADKSGNVTTAGNMNTQALTATTGVFTGAVTIKTNTTIGAWGADATYTMVSVNNDLTALTGCGMFGKIGVGDIYFQCASSYSWRVANVEKLALTASSFTVSAATTAVQGLTATSVVAPSLIAAAASSLSLGANGSSYVIISVGGILGLNTTLITGASAGDQVLGNVRSLRGSNAAANNTYSLIALNASDKVLVDADARGTVFGADITLATAKKVGLNAGITSYLVESATDTVGIVVTGQEALRLKYGATRYTFFWPQSGMDITNIGDLNFAIPNGVAPGGNPIGGGFLFAVAGALKWRGSSGTVTPIAPA